VEVLDEWNPYAECQILHHTPHPAHLPHGIIRLLASTRNQILYTPIRIDFHRAQVVKPLHQPRILSELLIECVAEVVCRVGGDKQDGFAGFCHLDGEGA